MRELLLRRAAVGWGTGEDARRPRTAGT